jgi:hypothetical protein
MLPPADARPGPAMFFDAHTKCCTYLPVLANFTVGRILDDADPALTAGRATVEARIEAGLGVVPLGLQAPPVRTLLYRAGGLASFGQARTLRCPHYVAEAGGSCGIWRHRNGVCSTWFCKYSRGATGQRFWQALDQLLATVERELARWALLRLDLDPDALGRLLPRGTDRALGPDDPLDGPTIDGRVTPEARRRFWGGWLGREREFYRAAGRLVSELGWDDVVQIGGASVQAQARIVAHTHALAGSEGIPARLVAGPLQTVAAGRNHVQVTTYSPYDPLELPRALVDVLAYFDGRPTAEALRSIRDERGLALQPDLVRRLVDFRVLVAPEGADDGVPRPSRGTRR